MEGQPMDTGQLSIAHKNRSWLLNILAFEFTNWCGESHMRTPALFPNIIWRAASRLFGFRLFSWMSIVPIEAVNGFTGQQVWFSFMENFYYFWCINVKVIMYSV
jgi:hypothetical protein